MKKQPKAKMMVRIEPDVEKEVRARRVRYGRTVQGEVNTTLRGAYSGRLTEIENAMKTFGRDIAHWNQKP